MSSGNVGAANSAPRLAGVLTRQMTSAVRWLRRSAYAYNGMAEYERLADMLPGVLRQLR